MIDDAGHTAWRIQLDPRGNTLDEDNPLDVAQPIRMQGQHYDEESGLFYNRYRYYDPETGRYVTQDPIGLAGGLNPYTYPLSPVTDVDPLGLFPKEFIPGSDAAAFFILYHIEKSMTSRNLSGTDNFFHCTAFCRVSKSKWASDSAARNMGAVKEFRDYILGRIGLYGDKRKRSHEEMIEDNIKDLKANEYGLTCPADTNCADRCIKYINPQHYKTKEILKNKGYL
nr:RHS repeat-associated core domain-containing protein [Affinibrenneria salicis]